MTDRRVGLLVFLGLVGGLTLVAGTGAFSSAAVDRPVAVELASDLDGAYLQLAPAAGPNGAFAHDRDGDGTLELAFDREVVGVDGAGPNPNALTRLVAVFTVTNQGTTTVGVWLDDGDVPAITLFTTEGAHGPLESRRTAVTLAPGEAVGVGLEIDARGERAGTRLLSRIIVHADAGVVA